MARGMRHARWKFAEMPFNRRNRKKSVGSIPQVLLKTIFKEIEDGKD